MVVGSGQLKVEMRSFSEETTNHLHHPAPCEVCESWTLRYVVIISNLYSKDLGNLACEIM